MHDFGVDNVVGLRFVAIGLVDSSMSSSRQPVDRERITALPVEPAERDELSGSIPLPGELLGHADMPMTLRYSHLSPAHLLDAVEKLTGSRARPPSGCSFDDRSSPRAFL